MEVKKRTISIDKEVKVLKLKVKVGTMIYDGSILLIYEEMNDEGDGNRQKKLKSTEIGIVKAISIKEGDIIKPGSVILELEKECNHPTVIKDLCAECGADLQKENTNDGGLTQASVSMVHMVPELKVNDELAQILGKADMDRLLEHQKLVLLVDLDQTLIHTTNDNIPNNIKDVCHFQLYGSRSPWYHTRLRPGTHNFLQGVSEKYELHICTFGSRRYAHMIAGFLDPDGKFFSHRILSRDECFDPNSKTANLKALFPCGENMVCIIDDREDVWEYASNLIHVKPYHFFQHTGDIHAPPGLTKCENDSNKDGYDFSRLNNGIPGETGDEKDSSDKSDEREIEDEGDIGNAGENPETNLPVEDLKEDVKSEQSVGINVQSGDLQTEIPSVPGIKMETDAPSETNEGVVVRNESISNETEAKNVVVKDEAVGVDDDQQTDSTLAEVDGDDTNKSSSTIAVATTTIAAAATITTTSTITPATNESPDVTDSDKGANDAEVSSQSPTKNQCRQAATATPPKRVSTSKINADGFIVIEETDDYLLYLEEILKIIHAEFFRIYTETGKIPDLKKVVPETRAQVLKGVNLAFSGIVPNRIRLEESQAYRIARSLGANVTQNIEPDTTHLVALRAGTAKVHAAYKRKNLKLVTPEWLWTCAERWEKVDERLFPLKSAKMNAEARHPPAHCRSPEHPEPSPFTYQSSSGALAATAAPAANAFSAPPAGGFMYTINPLMSLSSEDIETMEGEVEDIFKESDGEIDDPFGPNDDDVDDTNDKAATSSRKRKLSSDSDSSDGDLRSECKKRGRKKHKSLGNVRRISFSLDDIDRDDDDGDFHRPSSSGSDDDSLNTKFRRGESLPSDVDLDYNTEEGTEEDQESDGEWNVMGAALEREFLEGD